MFLKEITAKKIKDSRGEYTIEVSINGYRASSPSGKSTGKYEAKSYKNSLEWNIKAINNFKELKNVEINNFNDLIKIESLIKKKFNLRDIKLFGANALFALESAILKALAKSQRKELWEIIRGGKKISKKMPVPVGNVAEGGLHAHNLNRPLFQEFLLIPKSNSFSENYKSMKEIYGKLKRILKAKAKTDEGAWQTNLNNEQLFQILATFDNLNFGTDIAASEFYKNALYNYRKKSIDKVAQIRYINELIKEYNLFYIEDPLEENDFDGFAKIYRSQNHLVVGDDLTATHIKRLEKAIRKKAINAMIIKPNQNGSLLELKRVFDICKKNNIKTIISHRSGETLDDGLADYAFGFQADFIKCGIATKWREVKLKRLLEIEKSLKH